MRPTYLILFIILTGLLQSCKNEPKNEVKADKSNINIKATIVKTTAIVDLQDNSYIKQQGVVMSKTEAKPSFKTGGVIARTYVTEGQMVKKGQLLATLQMDEINAQVRQAEEGMTKAERDMSRARNLYADSVATLEQFQNATTAYEFAKRTVEIARFNRQYSEVRSPINGKVVKQIMRSGEIVGPGMPIYAILGVGEQDWVLKIGLVDKDWARVNVGDGVEISIDAYPGASFSGKVSEKSAVASGNSGTFDVEVKFNKQPTKLAAGLIAKAIIKPSTKENFRIIPIECLVNTSDSNGKAFTIMDGKAKSIDLTIARILGDKVAISSGLDGIQKLITTGAAFLEEGDLVTEVGDK